MKRKTGYNPKREIAPEGAVSAEVLAEMARLVIYGGNPQHKRMPGDYGLTPPASPRPRKTLCDALEPFPKAEASRLLKLGILKGLVSVRESGQWRQNVWAVSESGEAFEAQLENRDTGAYHGYPMPQDDDFRKVVMEEWKRR